MTPLLDTLVVKFKVWDEAHVEAVARRYGGTITIKLPQIRWAAVKIDHARASDLFLAFLGDPDVEDVDFDSVVKPDAYHSSIPATNRMADLLFPLKRMNVFAAWKHTKGEGIKAAVVDSGMNMSHRLTPSFASKPIEHWNSYYQGVVVEVFEGSFEDTTLDGYGPAADMLQHGFGCIAAISADGFAEPGDTGFGVAPKCSMVNISMFETQHFGSTALANGLLNAFYRFGAKVINCSYGTGAFSPPYVAPTGGVVWDAIKNLKGKAIVCTSAGNDGWNSALGDKWQAPAAYCAMGGGHFGVGCTSYEEFDKPASYSNGGDGVNIAAPGHTGISEITYPFDSTRYPRIAARGFPAPGWEMDPPYLSTGADGRGLLSKIRPFDGTSNASPLVAGVAVLVFGINPAFTADQVVNILLATTDKAQNPHFYERFKANVGVVNALKAVLQAKAVTAPGSIHPYVSFFGPGVSITLAGGVPTTHLRGALSVEVTGLSTDPIASVELWAGDEQLYAGPPRTTWGDNLLPLAAAKLAGRTLRVVARTATGMAEETYQDIVGYAVSSVPPTTKASPGAGETSQPIVLSAESDNQPVRISYRWAGGPWGDYSAPLTPRTGTLEFYGVDAVGNVEGGVDYARL